MNDRTGTRVAETGLALVHAGEYVVPALGSEAVFAAAGADGLHYHFPVEIDVRPRAAAARPANDDPSLDTLATHLGG